MKLRDLNPLAKPPGVRTLTQEEIEELQRAAYLEDKRADHHRAHADAITKRIAKLEAALKGGA